MASLQVLDRIREELIDTGRDTRYSIGGYEFVLNGMEFYITTIGEKRHVTGQELSKGLLNFAQKQYGPLAHTVLLHWGIESTEDFGNIVYNMIDIGIMSRQPEDSIEHFHNIVDIDRFFSEIALNCFKIDKEMVKKIKGA